MSSTHFHLLLNHFPIIGTLIGSCLLLWGILSKQDYIKSIAAVILTVMAIIAIPVFLTGEPAEESVEKLLGVSESTIKLHEEAAEKALWLLGITGLASIAAIFFAWQKKQFTNVSFLIVFALSVVSFASMARTGYLGGQIRHTEISNNNAVQNEQGNDKKVKEKDDD
jgi:uncharacterized membrane protein